MAHAAKPPPALSDDSSYSSFTSLSFPQEPAKPSFTLNSTVSRLHLLKAPKHNLGTDSLFALDITEARNADGGQEAIPNSRSSLTISHYGDALFFLFIDPTKKVFAQNVVHEGEKRKELSEKCQKKLPFTLQEDQSRIITVCTLTPFIQRELSFCGFVYLTLASLIFYSEVSSVLLCFFWSLYLYT